MKSTDQEVTEPAGETKPLGLSLRRNFSWVLMGQMVFYATNWLTTVFLAKFAGASVVGEYLTVVGIALPIVASVQLMLRSVLVTDTKGDFHFLEYLTFRVSTMLLSWIFLLGTCIVSKFDTYQVWCILAYAVTPSLDGIADILQGLLQKHQRMDRNGISMALRGVLNIVLFSVTYYLTNSLLYALVASAISSALLLLFYDTPNTFWVLRQLNDPVGFMGWRQRSASVAKSWKFDRQKALLLVALPIGLSVWLNSLGLMAPRLLVIHYLARDQVGIFGAISSLMNIGIQVVLAMGATVMPKLGQYHARGEQADFKRLTQKFLLLSLAVGTAAVVVTIFWGSSILMLCFGPEFAKRNDIFILTMVAGLIYFASLPLGIALTSSRLFAAQIWAAVTSLVSLVGFGVVLTPTYGLLGAAYATIIGMSVRLVTLVACSHIFKGSEKRIAA